MFKIDSKNDKPDIKYMYDRAVELMKDGIRLGDVDKIYTKFCIKRDNIKEAIQKQYSILNPNSSVQIANYMEGLQDDTVYDIGCIEGKWTTNKEVLGELSLAGYQFARDILEYRTYKKYAESVNSMIEAVGSDGRVHPTVTVGKTNRLNYIQPALMNIPKKLLWNIVAPKTDGNKLLSVDIKNQEPSILINLLDIEELKDALRSEKGLYESLFEKPFKQTTKATVYVSTGQQVRIVPAKEMAETETIPPQYYTPVKPIVEYVYYTGNEVVNRDENRVKLIDVCNTVTNVGEQPLLPETVAIETVEGKVYQVGVKWDKIKGTDLANPGIIQINGVIEELDVVCEGVARKEFKQAWNALTYGASIYGIRNMCKHINGDEIYKYFSKIPAFKKYKSNCSKLADRGIQNINTLFGTQLCAGVADTSRLKRILMDLPIQGTGADILSMLIKHFDEEVILRGLEGKLMLYYTRHDELIIEADNEWANNVGIDTVKEILRDILEHQIDNWVPFKVEIKVVEGADLSLSDGEEEEIY